ncbi:limulus clotting factor C-like [Branchiostoma floridae x Branchiostoma belcheri]
MAGVRSLFRVVLGFLCALESRGQTGCPDGYVYHQPNRLCYKAFNDTATYNGAVSRCSSDGGTLAMPRDNATNNFLNDLKNAVDINAFFRFGLTDVHQEGVWIWDDNIPLGDFRTWGPGEPNNQGNEDCAEYFSESHSYSNTWNDGSCTRDDKKFICQVSLSGQCWDPGVPANGIRDNNSNFTSGQTVRYTCMDGYWLLWGTANITCQPDGTWSGVPPTCGGCPTVVLYGDFDTRQVGKMTSYTMTGDTRGDRPVYYSSVTCDYLYYNKPAMGWRVGQQFDRNGVRVRDSALYADQINGTFLLWIRQEWIEDPDVKIACSDDVPAGVVVPQSVGGATNCARVRLHGGADYQPYLMTTYTRTDQTSGGRPVYVSDTDSPYFLYFVESEKNWWVGATIGQSNGFAYVQNCAMTPDQIRSPWRLSDGNQFQVVWSVTVSCVG